MDLFHVPIAVVNVPIEDRIEQAVMTILGLFRQRIVAVVAMSGGKDSTVTLMLALWAAERAAEEGLQPAIWILNADTGVESPVIAQHVRTDLKKAQSYAQARGIHVEVGIASPSISSSWLLRVVGGRALPSFPDNQSDCSVDWKVKPMSLLRNRLLRDIYAESNQEAVTLVGLRLSESVSRAQKMRSRNDSATIPTRNKSGELVLAPIAMWSEDDVWELLAMVRHGMLESYTDTEQLFAIYRDAGPTSCAVVNDSIFAGQASSRGGCGARTGCWTCVKVKTDSSMENFLAKPEYSYMQGLNDLREFIVATQFDLSRRQWLGRTIKCGYVAIRPDAYSPAMMRELFRYVLTLQAEENEAAQRLGIEPRFQIIDEAGIVGIDCMWSLNGYWPGFTAIEDYHAVFHEGMRYNIPRVDQHPRIDLPEPRFLYVGDWEEDLEVASKWNGLRDPVGEYLWEWSKCMTTRELADGRIVLDVNTDEVFTIDSESAYLTLTMDCERILDMRKNFLRIGGYTQGYKWWLARGTIALAKGQVGIHDTTLKRTAFKERWNLCGPNYDLNDLLDASVPWHEAPLDVQGAFIGESKLQALREKRDASIEASKQQLLFA